MSRHHGWVSRTKRLFRFASLPLFAALLAAAIPARAADIVPSGSVGAEYFTQADGADSRAVSGVVSLGIRGGELIGGALRYDHSTIGPGSGFIVGAGVPLAPGTELLAIGTRYIGDGDYRAWRVKTGPLLTIGTHTLGVYYLGEDNSENGRSDGGLMEGTAEWATTVTGRVSVGYAMTRSGSDAAYGSVGMGWRLVPHLELNGELGLAQNAWNPNGISPSPPHGLLDELPIIGGGGGGGSSEPSKSENQTKASALVSVRVPF